MTTERMKMISALSRVLGNLTVWTLAWTPVLAVLLAYGGLPLGLALAGGIGASITGSMPLIVIDERRRRVG